MKSNKRIFLAGLLAAGAVTATAQEKMENLPVPYATPSVVKYSKVIGWPAGQTPVAPDGFTVTKFADGFHNPRWIYVAPNGDIFVSDAGTLPKAEEESDAKEQQKAASQNMGAANRVYLFRDADRDGTYESRYTYLSGLRQPFGMLALGNHFYVANTDGLMRFPYDPSATRIDAAGEKIVELPAGGYNNHWTRNIIANPEGTKILISVGSASNNAEHGMEVERRRAAILEVNPDGSGEQFYAQGLRNPVGMGWNPVTGELWTVVNERDELGDELVPDYATSVLRGGFYGWPYAYMGAHEDPRMKGQRPDLVAETIIPDIPLTSHSATLGMAFYTGDRFPAAYRNGLFLVQHGSWNRSELVGYGVKFVPFTDGKPSGEPRNFLTGFIADAGKGEVHGRPVCAAVLPDGSLLITDDAAKTIWQVSYQK